ncbi:MAG: hypothetical protein ACRCX2_18410 [Paraclostridium sp.]
MPKEKLLRKYIENNPQKYSFNNPEILLNIIEELQKVIKYAIIVEGVDQSLVPKLILGDEPDDVESNKTQTYEKPVLSVSLSRRMSAGTNERTLTKLFDNNLIAGTPKYIRKVKGEPDMFGEQENLYEQGVYFTDNELCLTLKTKTVKEQLKIINILERALNIYARQLIGNFIVVCGIKEINTEEKKDNKKFETAKILFHMRLKEIVNMDSLSLIRGFQIFTSNENILDIYSGKIKEDGTWEDNPHPTMPLDKYGAKLDNNEKLVDNDCETDYGTFV